MASTDDWAKAFGKELKIGFDTVLGELRSVNGRLDQTNVGLNQTNRRLDETNKELREFKVETNRRFDETIRELRDFKKETGKKLDGLGYYLSHIDAQSTDHGQRLTNLEARVDNIEKRFDS